ncbi:unnamed protein product [Discosporangium mesarthrocarpum]
MAMQIMGKKALKELSSRSNDSAGSGYNEFAQRMMAKMGYKAGQGLGKEEQGRSTYVQVKKKDDNAGLGKEKAQQASVNDQWYFNAFDNALSNMGIKGKKKGKKGKKKGSKKDSGSELGSESSSSMYDQMFRATGGARMGMRARASQKGKWLRTEGGDGGAEGGDDFNKNNDPGPPGSEEGKEGRGGEGVGGMGGKGTTRKKRSRGEAAEDEMPGENAEPDKGDGEGVSVKDGGERGFRSKTKRRGRKREQEGETGGLEAAAVESREGGVASREVKRKRKRLECKGQDVGQGQVGGEREGEEEVGLARDGIGKNEGKPKERRNGGKTKCEDKKGKKEKSKTKGKKKTKNKGGDVLLTCG